MIWLFLSLLVLAVLLMRLRNKRFTTHWAHLTNMVTDLAEGKRPRGFIFHQAPEFTRVALALEKVFEEQKLLREQANTREYNLQTVLASMAEGVVVVDANHTIRLVNQAFLKLIGLQSSPVGKSLLSGVRSGEVDAVVRLTLETHQPHSREIMLSAVGSQPRYFEINATPVTDPLTKRNDVVAVFHDISRLRRLEELRREFVANVSHELKTPLSIFQGYLETLEDPNLPPAQIGEMVGILKKHSVRLNAILEDLLTLARLEARSEKLERIEIALPEFIGQLLKDWEPRCGDKQLSACIDPELPALKADPIRLQQVITNLLQNAIKYTPAGGSIVVRAYSKNGKTTIAVEDTGIGIPPADLPHIFERFYRVEKGRSRDTGGTGLGLSIVKHIMAMHGGSAQATSEPGKGTTISVVFP